MKCKLFIFIGLISFFSCEKEIHQPISLDSTAPGQLSSIEVTPLSGGGIIKYVLPTDTDILYVSAKYQNGTGASAEERSSSYTQSITVNCFNTEDPQSIALTVVDKSGNSSPEQIVTLVPLESPISALVKTGRSTAISGGSRFNFDNPSKSLFDVFLYLPDEDGADSLVQNFSTNVANIEFAIRDLLPTEITTKVIFRDRWLNFSTPVEFVFTPLAESRIEKTEDMVLILPGDADGSWWEGEPELMFDDDNWTWNHTWTDYAGPQVITIDLGKNRTLTRLNMLARPDREYRGGNVKKFEIWGIAGDDPGDGSFDGYELLLEGENFKPSEQGGTTEDDQTHLNKGDQHEFLGAFLPNVRYIRLKVTETWSGVAWFNIAELTFWEES